MKKIKCDGVAYRKGFLEISSNIHHGFVNIEAWNIDPDIDISDKDFDAKDLPDNAFVGNIEIELSIENVEELLGQLKDCIAQIKSSSQC